MDPFRILREAIKAVPAVRYALAVAGVVSVVAIIQGFKLDFRVALFGALAVLLLMVMMVIFARLTRASGKSVMIPALVFTWFCLGLTMATATTLFTSVFFSKPLDLTAWVNPREGSKAIPDGKVARFQFDNTGSWFGTYASGTANAKVLKDGLSVTIENGEVKRNPGVSDNRVVKYISVGVAQSRADSWQFVSHSPKQSVNWQLQTDADVKSLDGMHFFIPIFDRTQLIHSWIVVDLSDGEGSVYANSGPLF